MAIIRKLIGAVFALIAIALAVATVAVFRVIRFWVDDGLGDSREMMGDGPQPSWWHDFFRGGWYLSYIPAALLFGFSILFVAIALSLFRRRVNAEHQSAQNQ